MKSYVKLCRPHQYLKNTFVLAPSFFAANLLDPAVLQNLIPAFLAYCLLASCVYIFNDWQDREEDRHHPSKKLRPLASGAVSPQAALVLALVLLLAASTLVFFAVPQIAPLLGFYLALNLAYTAFLKRVALLDVFIISMGFVVRLYVGGVAADVPLSRWIVTITFLLALFLALAKRRDDVVLSDRGLQARAAIAGYNELFLSTCMSIVAAVVIVAYLMYSISEDVVARVGDEHLFFSTFFVLLGFLRYLQVTFVDGTSGSPTRVVLTDRFLQIVIFLWVCCFAYFIY